jgi:hypothetical protein
MALEIVELVLTPEEAADEGNLVVKDFAEAEGEAGAGEGVSIVKTVVGCSEAAGEVSIAAGGWVDEELAGGGRRRLGRCVSWRRNRRRW